MTNAWVPIQRYLVQGGTGWAGIAPAGSLLRVIDVDAKQVGDLVLFRRADPTDRFSAGNTRKMANSIFISTGAIMWSTRYRQLAQIEVDTVGRHDLLASACTPYDYPIRFGERGIGHRACLSNLSEALKPYGIEESLIPDPMNVFMRQDVRPDGTTEVLEAPSAAGDHLELRLLEECIVGLSACPQDLNPTNGWHVTDMAVEIEPPAAAA